MLEFFELAIEDLSRAIETNPSEIDLYTLRARTYYQIKDYTNAVKDYLYISELDIKNVGCFESLTELEILRENYNHSKEYAYKILHITKEYSHRAIGYFFLCIDNIILDRVSTVEKEKFIKLLRKDFQIDWDFSDLEFWLQNIMIDSDKLNSINDLIKIIKVKSEN